jgi:hypothetical protein
MCTKARYLVSIDYLPATESMGGQYIQFLNGIHEKHMHFVNAIYEK